MCYCKHFYIFVIFSPPLVLGLPISILLLIRLKQCYQTKCSRDKFVENLLMVEDIVVASEDNSLERMSQEYTGFKKFLFGSLEALDINVSDYIGDIKFK